MAMFLKEISSSEEKVDVQYFRYENWKEYLSLRQGAFEQDTLKDNLINVFEDITKNSWTDPDPDLALQPPRILVRARLNWYDCDSEGRSCGDNKGDTCEECPHGLIYDTNFVYGNIIDPRSEDIAVIPLEVMKALIKCMIGGFSIPIHTELELVNLETGNTIISCGDVEKCDVLVVEIDTTELEATKKLLKQLDLLPA